VRFIDDHWVHAGGGEAVAEVTDEAIYLVMSLRNAGNGIAALQAWSFSPELLRDFVHGDPDQFHRLTRDIYVPPNDVGFWQGALRDPSTEEFQSARRAIQQHQGMTIDVLYTDHEGGQRTISRFVILPRSDAGWLTTVAKHWNLDGHGPR
jgi:hypothetical protein